MTKNNMTSNSGISQPATGLRGFFELTESLQQYTTARILNEVGEKTPVFTRLSTVAGGAGSLAEQFLR